MLTARLASTLARQLPRATPQVNVIYCLLQLCYDQHDVFSGETNDRFGSRQCPLSAVIHMHVNREPILCWPELCLPHFPTFFTTASSLSNCIALAENEKLPVFCFFLIFYLTLLLQLLSMATVTFNVGRTLF